MNDPSQTEDLPQGSASTETEQDLSGHMMDKTSDELDHERPHGMPIAGDTLKDATKEDQNESANTPGTLQTSAEEANKLHELESLYRSIEAYEWESDKVYQRALQSMSQTSNLTPYELELQAKCYYWSRKKQTKVDYSSYKNWKIARDQDSSGEPSNNAQIKSEEPPVPYPQNFQEVADMITSGRGHLLPGIKEIPPVVLADKITQPTGEVRKKPWESGDAEDPAAKGGMFGDRRDIFIRQE